MIMITMFFKVVYVARARIIEFLFFVVSLGRMLLVVSRILVVGFEPTMAGAVCWSRVARALTAARVR